MFYRFLKWVNRGILITIPTILWCFLDYIILDLTKIIHRSFSIYSGHIMFSEETGFLFGWFGFFWFFFLFFLFLYSPWNNVWNYTEMEKKPQNQIIAQREIIHSVTLVYNIKVLISRVDFFSQLVLNWPFLEKKKRIWKNFIFFQCWEKKRKKSKTYTVRKPSIKKYHFNKTTV